MTHSGIGFGTMASSGGGSEFSFFDEYSSDLGYTLGSGNSIGSGKLTLQPASSSLGFTYDIGTGVLSDTAWVLRIYDYKVTSFSWSAAMSFRLGFSNNATPVAYNDGSTQGFGMNLFNRLTANFAIHKLYTNVNGTTASAGTESGTDIVLNTSYWIEIKRTGTTTGELNIYTDSGFSSAFSTQSLSSLGNPTGLRYFSLNAQTGGGTHIATIDKVELKSGVTSW